VAKIIKIKKVLILISILVNLGIFGFFKYYNFFLESFVTAFSFFGNNISAKSLDIILSLGISFYIFKILGSHSVFDFSSNNKITSDYPNYYERSHYKSTIGKQILEIIYSQDAKSKIDQLAQN